MAGLWLAGMRPARCVYGLMVRMSLGFSSRLEKWLPRVLWGTWPPRPEVAFYIGSCWVVVYRFRFVFRKGLIGFPGRLFVMQVARFYGIFDDLLLRRFPIREAMGNDFLGHG